MLAGATVDEAADRLPGDVVDPGLTAGADGDEFFFGLYRATQGDTRECRRQDPCQGFAFHGGAPFLPVVKPH
ncbi:hypothetical protein D3C86_1806600 [compost metagenome]